MKFAFRTDASLQIGTGHVMRCLTLAKALRAGGAECKFICREHEGHLIEKIRHEGFECIALVKSAELKEMHDAKDPALAHADWLGASCQSDAQDTINALGMDRVDWLVVDHYALGKRWEETLRPYATKIMVIDDLADRHHDCDLLLDQNLVANFETRYQHLLPEHCASLLGPKHALLQPEYAELHPRTPPRTGPVKRILAFFGGADQHNLTGLTVSAFLRLKRDDIDLDVVISPNSPHTAKIQALAQTHAKITVYGAVPSLAPLMLQADVAVGAGGATSWERCCLGLPSLVITLAENQKPIAAELDKRCLVRWLGHYDAVTDDRLLDALQAAIDNKVIKNWSQACMTVIDGGGVNRVASVLALNSETKLQARLARLDDEALLLCWANDPLVRANAFNSEAITAETHQKWFYSRLRDLERCKMYIVETQDGLPIGQVRFECVEREWEIHYSLVSFARGLGLARNLLRIAMNRFRIGHNGAQLFGRVRQGNLPSQKVFEELGFSGSHGAGQIVYCHML
jgi:UDP-2,4-diacetamido-2,4,6-trideoxy-beta-L-altropyranose hydrolase